jgi:hypothetical protein
MSPGSVDAEMAVLAPIPSDRCLRRKVLNEGLHPELLHSSTGWLIAETLGVLWVQMFRDKP